MHGEISFMVFFEAISRGDLPPGMVLVNHLTHL